jgi:hypothetical protein
MFATFTPIESLYEDVSTRSRANCSSASRVKTVVVYDIEPPQEDESRRAQDLVGFLREQYSLL